MTNDRRKNIGRRTLSPYYSYDGPNRRTGLQDRRVATSQRRKSDEGKVRFDSLPVGTEFLYTNKNGATSRYRKFSRSEADKVKVNGMCRDRSWRPGALVSPARRGTEAQDSTTDLGPGKIYINGEFVQNVNSFKLTMVQDSNPGLESRTRIQDSTTMKLKDCPPGREFTAQTRHAGVGTFLKYDTPDSCGMNCEWVGGRNEGSSCYLPDDMPVQLVDRRGTETQDSKPGLEPGTRIQDSLNDLYDQNMRMAGELNKAERQLAERTEKIEEMGQEMNFQQARMKQVRANLAPIVGPEIWAMAHDAFSKEVAKRFEGGQSSLKSANDAADFWAKRTREVEERLQRERDRNRTEVEDLNLELKKSAERFLDLKRELAQATAHADKYLPVEEFVNAKGLGIPGDSISEIVLGELKKFHPCPRKFEFWHRPQQTGKTAAMLDKAIAAFAEGKKVAIATSASDQDRLFRDLVERFKTSDAHCREHRFLRREIRSPGRACIKVVSLPPNANMVERDLWEDSCSIITLIDHHAAENLLRGEFPLIFSQIDIQR